MIRRWSNFYILLTMEIKDRMEQHRLQEGLSVQAFEKKLGVSNGTWKKAKSISEDVLIKFVRTFPDINSEWLLTGDEKGQEKCEERINHSLPVRIDENKSHNVESLTLSRAKAKVVVEIDLDEDEFVKLGLSSKVVQILKQK